MNSLVTNDPDILISAQGVSKSYPMLKGELPILHALDIVVRSGDAICIMGSSGAGKSTLLHILGTLDRPTTGQIFYKGEEILSKSEEWLARFRNRKMGFVFQFHNLLHEFSAVENVMMPLRIAGVPLREARKRAELSLDELGMLSRRAHFPAEMSGGEQQRISIARSLICQPEILFADEPTGNLDSQNALKIQELFFDLKARKGLTLVVVTHDREFASRFPKLLTMRDGRWAELRGS